MGSCAGPDTPAAMTNDAPKRFFPYTQMDVVCFPEGTGGDCFEQKVVKGPWAHGPIRARDMRGAGRDIQRNFVTEAVQQHPTAPRPREPGAFLCGDQRTR